MRREQGTPVSYSPGIGFFVGEGGERGRLWANPADKKYRDGEIKIPPKRYFLPLIRQKNKFIRIKPVRARNGFFLIGGDFLF